MMRSPRLTPIRSVIPGPLATLGRDGPLNFQCAVDSVDDTCELNQRTVANQFDDPAAMPGDRRVENGFSVVLQGRQRTGFVEAHHPRVAYYVGSQDGSEPPAGSHFAHGAICMGYYSAVPARPEFTQTRNRVVKIQRLVSERSNRSPPFQSENLKGSRKLKAHQERYCARRAAEGRGVALTSPMPHFTNASTIVASRAAAKATLTIRDVTGS